MKTLLCFFLLITASVLVAQERFKTNYFTSSKVNPVGDVDSLFQVDFEVYNGEENPVMYNDYVFDKQGNIISHMNQSYGASWYTVIESVYKNGLIESELIDKSFGDPDTNKFSRDSKGRVSEIRGPFDLIKIQYDAKSRVSQMDFGYPDDDFILRTQHFTYTNNDTYTETESSDGNIYAVREYVNGEYRLEVYDNILGGSDISIYVYNKKGDRIEAQRTGPYSNDFDVKYTYEYDDRDNWIKVTTWIQVEEGESYVSDYSTRKIVYSDGHSTGYEVQY